MSNIFGFSQGKCTFSQTVNYPIERGGEDLAFWRESKIQPSSKTRTRPSPVARRRVCVGSFAIDCIGDGWIRTTIDDLLAQSLATHLNATNSEQLLRSCLPPSNRFHHHRKLSMPFAVPSSQFLCQQPAVPSTDQVRKWMMVHQTMASSSPAAAAERTVSIEQQQQQGHEKKLGPVRHSPTAINANIFDSVDDEFSMIEPPPQQHPPSSLLVASGGDGTARGPNDDNKLAGDGWQQQLPHRPPPPTAMASSVSGKRQKQWPEKVAANEQKTRLHQQQREIRLARGLLIAFCHASRCTAPSCTMSRYCRDFKIVWKHITVHHQQPPQPGGGGDKSSRRKRHRRCCGCHHPACLQGRAVLEHFGRCQRRKLPRLRTRRGQHSATAPGHGGGGGQG